MKPSMTISEAEANDLLAAEEETTIFEDKPETIYLSEKGLTISKHLAMAQNLSHGVKDEPVEYRRVGVCEWTGDGEEDYEMHETSCGNAFTFNIGGVKNNNCEFCMYCGKKVVT